MFLRLLVFAAPLIAQDLSEAHSILKRRCYGCHGPALHTSGLRLDTRAAALTGGYSGPVIIPGNAAGSKMIQYVESGVGGKYMPPAGARLTTAEVAVLRSWIEAGAKWPESSESQTTSSGRKSDHWSFQPIRNPMLPVVRAKDWAKQPVDRFILATLEREGTQPSPAATKAKLLRRVSFDLTGLPPAVEDLKAFLNDKRADAYERIVDRLLSSPHLGEKWARHWLDLARYSDSDGYQKDEFRPNAFRYRDWVIDAFNRDMPFDQFTIEQIAGDLLPGAGVSQKTATGFHRMTLTSREAGIDLKQLRAEQVEDRTSTVASVWMGLTVGCAACHDHKFDPISQKEHYQLYAFFNAAQDESLEAPLPQEKLIYDANFAVYARQRDALLAEYGILALQPEFERHMRDAAKPNAPAEWVANLELLPVLIDGGDKILAKDTKTRTDYENYLMRRYIVRTYSRAVGSEKAKSYRLGELKTKLDALDEKYPRFSEPMVLAQMNAAPKTHIHLRGDFRQLGIEVQPGIPSVFPPLKPGSADRITLARWLVSNEHPLTARVAVNRVWQELFGRGIVATSDDFGTRGDRPTHPELLDWLAFDFRANGWSMKKLIRKIVLSAAYRQSSKPRQDLAIKDPTNLLLARQSRFRLPAELVRDAALSTAGLLNVRVGGRSVRPPIPPGVIDFAFNEDEFIKWTPSPGADRYRRGIYTQMHRSVPYPQNVLFDAPDGLVSCSRRNRSTTALQALTLLNDPVFVEAAKALGERLRTENDPIESGFQIVLSRSPKPDERARLRSYLEEQNDWTGMASVLLNLDEFLTRE